MALMGAGQTLSEAEQVLGHSAVSGDEVRDALRMLAHGQAVESGAVNLISLLPIKTRLGERWPRRREQIWEHAQTFLKRQFRAEDVMVRLDEETLLIFQPGAEPLAAQSRCVRASSELMKFFIGESSADFVQVKIVTHIEGDEITCTPLAPQHLKTMLQATQSGLGRAARTKSVPVLTRLGRQLSIELSLEPLWSLQPTPRVIGHYARASVVDLSTGQALGTVERSHLQPAELVDMDMAVLKDAIALRAATPKLAGGLIIPVSYLTLANSSTRYELLQAAQNLDPKVLRSFGWEIVDVESGIPAGRLSELVGIARRYCRGVVCRIALSAENAEKVGATGATLSVAPPATPYTEHALFKLEHASVLATRAVRALMLHGVPADLLPIAGFIHATHCTVLEASEVVSA